MAERQESSFRVRRHFREEVSTAPTETQGLLSATDLVDWAVCPRRLAWRWAAASGMVAVPPPDDTGRLLSREAQAQEALWLERLCREGRQIVRPDQDHDPVAATMDAMRNGVDVIVQGTLRVVPWEGRPDFLLRVDGASSLGSWHYTVLDTKLAHTGRAPAIIQTVFYALLLEAVQGRAPEQVQLALGQGAVMAYPVRDFRAVVERLRHRVLASASELSHAWPEPDPVPSCGTCLWLPRCDEERRQRDHLALVADIRRDQIRHLREAGIMTLAALADAGGRRVPGIGAPTLDRLVAQARLQRAGATGGAPVYECLPAVPGQGLAVLPPPSPGDLYFDLEGDPFAEGGRLEYLFGWLDAEGRYHYRFAHDGDAERSAFETFVDAVVSTLASDPAAHVYHYGTYEPSTLLRLAGRYATREASVDDLLRRGVFVDLYRIVRAAVRVSTESYSLKALEPFYWSTHRSGSVRDAGQSIVVYRLWRSTRDPALLESLRAYNEDDCRSTAALRDWLERLRREMGIGVPAGVPTAVPSSSTGLPDDDPPGNDLLARLRNWHRREARSVWRAYFERVRADAEDLFDDPEAIADVTLRETDEEHLVFAFDPQQELKLRVGDPVYDPDTEREVGTIVDLNLQRGSLTVQARARLTSSPVHLVGGRPVSDAVIAQALQEVAALDRDTLATRYPVVAALLDRRPPSGGAPLQRPDESVADAAKRWAAHPEGTVLAIQGPPGTGKTHVGGEIIAHLVRTGRTVGITGNSHKVITQLVAATARAWGSGQPLPAVQRARDSQGLYWPGVLVSTDYKTVRARVAEGDARIVAGTAWLFSRPEWRRALDVLVIDEAGQFALADAVAVATAASALVLLGDPQQLRQPVTGSHPPSTAVSVLEHWLNGAATMPADAGLFLPDTRRMHPTIAAYVSTLMYEGRVGALPELARQAILGPAPWGGAGLRFVAVPHEGRRTTAPEEVAVVAALVRALLTCRFRDAAGSERPLALDDILVVAPFNAHVNRLLQALPAGSRVGTVDRFQGQEAPVVIYALGASDAHAIRHGFDFLYSLNRLNVAVSRARALAVLVASPRLLDAVPDNPEDLRLVNALAAFAAAAEPIDPTQLR